MPYFEQAKKADAELRNESAIQNLTTLQEAVYKASWGVVEVETRDRGYSIEDAREAEYKYKVAKEAYKAAFGMEPEWEDKYLPGLHGMAPLAKPTPQRIIELCGSEIV